MNTELTFVLVAFLLLSVFAYLAWRRSGDLRVDQALAAIRALDIEAFRNLVDPQEENFLRATLTPGQFRKIKRERAVAALAYVKALSGAALQFARFGSTAQRSPDPAIAASGREIANRATYLRLSALEASVGLMISAAFPGLGPRPLRSLLEQYDRASQLLRNHTGLQTARRQAS